MEPEWHSAADFSLYEVTRDGRLRHRETRRISKLKAHPSGYIRPQLYKDDRKTRVTIGLHRLIAQTFLPNPKNLPLVDHINGKKDDNRVENLRWSSPSDNVKNVQQKRKSFGLSRPILQLTCSGKLVEKHNSAQDAARKYGLQPTGIFLCCNGKITHSEGFVWKYADVDTNSNETWIDLILDERTIQISNMGRIKLENGRITDGWEADAGYRRCNIQHGGKNHTYRVHRLVLMAYEKIN